MIHVALAIDDRYTRPCGVALRSLLDHNHDARLTVHLFHAAAAPPRDLDSLVELIVRDGGHAVAHPIAAERLSGLPEVGEYPAEVWFRIFLAEDLPEVERVLYLDADTFVAGSIDALVRADMYGAPLAAVRNIMKGPHFERVRALGADPDRYLNSGVLLFDLKAWREENAAHQVVELARRLESKLVWPDQDVLNIAFRDRWLELDPRFNAQTGLWEDPDLAAQVYGAARANEGRDSPVVVHFEGPELCKPWHTAAVHPWRTRWRDTAARTTWGAAPLLDSTVVTRAVARLPPRPRLHTYLRVVGIRHRVARARQTAAKLLRGAGAEGQLKNHAYAFSQSLDPELAARVSRCRPYTLTSTERLVATIDAVQYVVQRGVPGALVECGVWRGGNALAMILALQSLGRNDRELWLYDTFEGMTAPSAVDTTEYGEPALAEWQRAQAVGRRAWGNWFTQDIFTIEKVRDVLAGSGYPMDLVHLIEGPVEKTLPDHLPDEIAVLRLDTDWYESTRHELIHLYPRLSPGGVLVIDDYGHWDGARKAVDEYLSARGETLLLNRTDYAGRVAVRP